jgi:hypothetical protein
MAKHAAPIDKANNASMPATNTSAGRVFSISLKGIPRVDAQARARLEAAARNPSNKRRNYPELPPG